MRFNRSLIVKGLALAVWVAILVSAGIAFAQHRQYKEAVVLGPGVTEVKKLSDYYAPLKGSPNDCNIYLLDSGTPGATLLVIAAVHAEEPATNLAAAVLVENAKPIAGRVVVAIHQNRSASTVTRPGDAYPQFYTIKTDWGEKKFRMGDRWVNPLDSWPDPETYVHFPSGQLLAYMDVRNMNRTWPGRPNGSLAERTSYAFMRLIEQEGVDLTIDLHEAELEYPIIGTIVAHQGATNVAAMTSMTLTAKEFRIGMEISPLALHGLSHREIGDFSNSPALLLESPEPFLDRVRGVTDEALLLTGKDEFVMKAGEAGLLYWPIDENGWPIDVRVARHVRTMEVIAEMWTRFHKADPLVLTGLPGYQELIDNGVGHYFANPDSVDSSRVAYE
jgi:hypothetical protein